LNSTNNDRRITFSGGIMLLKDGKVTGAAGASSTSLQHEVKVAEAAIKMFENL